MRLLARYCFTMAALLPGCVVLFAPAAVAQTPVTTISTQSPFGVGINQNTGRVYVTNASVNKMSVIDTSTNAVTATVTVGDAPQGVAANTVTNTVYVANACSNSMSVINGDTNAVTSTIPIPNGTQYSCGSTHHVAVNETTNRIYVTHNSGNAVTVIDGASNTILGKLPVGLTPTVVAVNKETNKIYVANNASSSVSVIDGNTNTVLKEILVGLSPNGIGVNTLTNRIYVANYGSGFGTQSVSVIDGTGDTNVATIAVPHSPYGVTVNGPANAVYVSTNVNRLYVIDGSSNMIVGQAPTNSGSRGIAVSDVTNRVYVANEAANNVSVISGMPAVQFVNSNYQVGEGELRATITVRRIYDAPPSFTVGYQTVDDPAAVPCDPTATQPDGRQYPQGAAYARCDYSTSIDTLRFDANQLEWTFTVPLIDDAHVEGNETATLRLLNPAGATVYATGTAALTIMDNDVAGAANPLNATSFFVRMHYLDFLSREPEAGEPWSGVLNRCPNPFNLDPDNPSAACDRITVSQSFFGSPEFRLKGFYAFSFYRVAFNRRPAYEEIIPDMRSLAGATQGEVYARRAAFPGLFVNRSEFKGRYDPLSNTAYVNTLLEPYGLQQITTPDPVMPEGETKVVLTRADLVSRLGGSGAQALTRAQVLRAVVESDEVGAAEYNRAFVAMQYYGYLRRTPEEGGYQAWLRVINQDPNDIRAMINGFVNSQEYRLRFGQP